MIKTKFIAICTILVVLCMCVGEEEPYTPKIISPSQTAPSPTTSSGEWKEFAYMDSKSTKLEYPPNQEACEHYWEFSAPWKIDEGFYRFTLTKITIEEVCEEWYIKFILILGETESKPVCLNENEIETPLEEDVIFWEFSTPAEPTLKIEIHNVKSYEILIERKVE